MPGSALLPSAALEENERMLFALEIASVPDQGRSYRMLLCLDPDVEDVACAMLPMGLSSWSEAVDNKFRSRSSVDWN